MRTVVTGLAWFIGSHLSEALSVPGGTVVGLDDRSTGSAFDIAPLLDYLGLRFVGGSELDTALVERHVAHSERAFQRAATVGVHTIVDHPVRSLRTAIDPASTVLDAARRHGRRLLLSSTGEVDGKNRTDPLGWEADQVLQSRLTSGWSHAAARALDELTAHTSRQADGLRVLLARLLDTIGLRQTGRSGIVVPQLVCRVLPGALLSVAGDARTTRRFWHVAVASNGRSTVGTRSATAPALQATAPTARFGTVPHPSRRFVDALASPTTAGTRLHHCFEHTADARPHAVALECHGQPVTYCELDEHANRLAHLLLARGLRPGSRIGILVPRSVEMYVALLAALKAAATFVPIDPGSPADRVAFIVDDADVDLVLTTSHFAAVCHDLAATAVPMDASAAAIAAAPSHRPDVAVPGDPTCYIIYTSGSSGRPKGVEVAQSSICNFIRVVPEIYGVEPSARVYQGMTISFDFSIEEIWPTWAVGATVVAGPTDGRRVGPGLAEFLEVSGVTMIYCVPTVLATLDRPIPSITTVNVGGEACPPELVERWAPGRRMLNTYGPTETTVTCTWAELEPGRPVTIGTPLPTYTATLLDEDLRPVPRGEVGEICVGGPGVARGYVNRSDLTAERFVRPGSDGPRIYRTGDLGRYLPDGTIEYLGRADAEVKVRGHRVDLQEIESVLFDDDRVAMAVVRHLPRPGTGGELAGYLVLKAAAAAHDDIVRELHERARATLPAYMVPAYLEPVDTIPMMPSGKVDRKALPDPSTARLVGGTGAHRAAQTPTERRIAAVWEEVLGLAPDSLSVDTHFFDDLGGHSLLAATVVSRLRADGIASDLSVLDLYDHPTVRHLASHRDGLQAAAAATTAAGAQRPPPPPGWRVAAFGLTQLGWIYSLLVVFLLPVSLVYGINGGRPSWTIMWQLVVAFPVSYLFGRWLLPILLVRVVTAGIRAGTYPLWGPLHLRVWTAHKLMTMSPLRMLAGSPWAATYLRLAGASVGAGCHIGTAEIRLPTLVVIEDGVTVGSQTHVGTSEIADGVLTIGEVRIGADAVVAGNCVLQGPCTVGAGAWLAEQSLLQPGDAIPPNERWGGSPSRPRAGAHDRVMDRMVGCPSAPRRWPRRLLPWFAVGLVFLEALPLLALTPVVGLVWWTLLTRGELAALLATAASGPVFVLMTCLLLLGARRLALRAVPVGIHHLRSTIGTKKWFGDKLLELSLLLTNTLYATLYTPMWLRALGARVGRRAEVSTIANIDPDLLVLDDDSFVADMASVGGATHANGHLYFRVTEVGRRAFVGNAAFVSSGTHLGDDSLVGVLTTPPAGGIAPRTSWLGSPPFFLPQRETWDGFTEAETFRPGRRQVLVRYAIELLRIVAPSSILALSTFVTLYALSFVAAATPLWAVVLATPLLALLASLATVLLVAVVKWVVVGRYRPRVEPLWSGFTRRTEFVTGLFEATAVPVLLGMLTGTPLLGPLLRLFGTRVGRRTLVDTTYLTEFDLVRIGDDATVGTAASLQTHLFEDRVMKMSTIALEARASVGTRAILLYDTVVGEEVSLAPLSLVMKAERLLPRTRWCGIPVRAARAHRPAEPAPPSSARSDAGLPSAAVRIAGIDVACGMAVLGMIAMHATSALTPSGDVSAVWALALLAALFALLVCTGLAASTHRRGALRGARWTATVVGLVMRSVRISVVGLLLVVVVRADTATIALACYALLFSLAVAEAARSLAGGAGGRGRGRSARGQPRRALRDDVAHQHAPAVRRPVDPSRPARRGAHTHRPRTGTATIGVRMRRDGDRPVPPDRPLPRPPDDGRRDRVGRAAERDLADATGPGGRRERATGADGRADHD